MTNLKTMIENDSDYGDEADLGASSIANEKVPCSQQDATSVNCSQSVQSASVMGSAVVCIPSGARVASEVMIHAGAGEVAGLAMNTRGSPTCAAR